MRKKSTKKTSRWSCTKTYNDSRYDLKLITFEFTSASSHIEKHNKIERKMREKADLGSHLSWTELPIARKVRRGRCYAWLVLVCRGKAAAAKKCDSFTTTPCNEIWSTEYKKKRKKWNICMVRISTIIQKPLSMLNTCTIHPFISLVDHLKH